MNKDNFLFGIIGLLIGGMIGFGAANSLNRNAVPPKSTAEAPPADNPNLPANHPAFVQTDNQTKEAPLPQVTEAIENARKKPEDFEAQMTAGDLYYQIQRFVDATEFYKQATKIRPNELEPIVKLGNSYFDGERYEEAEKWYETALQKKPDDVNIRTDYGLTFFLRTPRDVDRAIKEYKVSLSYDPNHELTLQNLAIAYKEKKDPENLQKTLETLTKVNPNNPLFKDLPENAGSSPPN